MRRKRGLGRPEHLAKLYTLSLWISTMNLCMWRRTLGRECDESESIHFDTRTSHHLSSYVTTNRSRRVPRTGGVPLESPRVNSAPLIAPNLLSRDGIRNSLTKHAQALGGHTRAAGTLELTANHPSHFLLYSPTKYNSELNLFYNSAQQDIEHLAVVQCNSTSYRFKQFCNRRNAHHQTYGLGNLGAHHILFETNLEIKINCFHNSTANPKP